MMSEVLDLIKEVEYKVAHLRKLYVVYGIIILIYTGITLGLTLIFLLV